MKVTAASCCVSIFLVNVSQIVSLNRSNNSTVDFKPLLAAIVGRPDNKKFRMGINIKPCTRIVGGQWPCDYTI